VADEPAGLWAISDIAPDGTYITTVQYGDDLAIPLTRDGAQRYAIAVLTACQHATYDAAVLAQMTKMTGKTITAAELVFDLRKDRPPVDNRATRPLRFEPYCSAFGKPGIFLWFAGEKVAQLDIAAAQGHALGVLNASIVVDLDAAYRRLLVDTVGTDEELARTVVGELAHHRVELGVDRD
jgi:hypothetical protein